MATVLERLGHLYDEGGDLENAAKYYSMLVELWADADAELQPRVQAAPEAAGGDRGGAAVSQKLDLAA